MKDATSGFFTQTGLCFDSGGNQENINFGCVISGFVYYNGTHYKNSSQVTIEDYNYTKDNDGKSCDSTLTNGDFNPDGMLTLNGCSAVGSTVRVDKNNNYYFTENCDNSASQCAIVSSSLNSPWQKTGVCCSNSCQGYADSNCCSDSDCGAEAICYDYECVGKAIGIQIRNLGLTGFEQINQSVTSIRSVMLNLVFNSTLAQKCRYINFDDNSNVPSNDSEDWSQWETCISTKVWELNPSQGLKTVYYQIDYGSYFKIANDSIYYNSSGGGLDITPPNPPYIIDGEFTNNLTILKISWFNASDPESEILNIPLIYKVNAFSNGVYTNTITTRSNTYNLDISNLNLQNNSVIYVNVTVVNSAGLTAETISDGVIVDTEKPQGTNVEGYFLNITNNLWTSFNYNLINENTYVAAKNVNLTWKEKFSDAISGIDAYSYIISKDINANVDDIPEGSIGNFDKEVSKIFNLASGKYYFKVKAKDKAGNWGLPIIFNFSIDSTYPSFPKLISLNYSNKYLTAKWQTSTDPESDVYGYNLTIINSTLKPVYSIIVSGKDTNEYTFDLSSFSTDDYNLTIGAINFAGLISWNYQTKYADFEPPNIIAKPNNSLVITNEPIIAVWTDEDAICYYNNSNEFIEFIYTNTTYHETKLNLDYDYYIYKIKCSDMYDNSAEVLINFTITNKEVANLIINPITKLYENIISKILINLTDSSNNLLVGADVDLIKIEGFDNKDIFVLDNLDGTYTIEFNSPKAGEYNLNLKYNALEQPLNLNFEKLYLYAQFNNPLYNNPSELNKENRIIYKSDNGYIFGLASENIETNTNLSLNISINEPIFIINTKEN
ncbi:MAG: hypothetical protein QW757_03055, partial [Candidatus Woesearchaeota archaeon]